MSEENYRKTPKEDYEVRFANIESAITHITDAVDKMSEILKHKSSIDVKAILYSVLATVTLFGATTAGITYIVSANIQPLVSKNENIESNLERLQNLANTLSDNQITINADLLRQGDKVLKNVEFIDNWYNDWRIPQIDAKQTLMLDNLNKKVKTIYDEIHKNK